VAVASDSLLLLPGLGSNCSKTAGILWDPNDMNDRAPRFQSPQARAGHR